MISFPFLSKSGKYYSVNFPLQEGIDDVSFEKIFKPVVDKASNFR